MRTSPVRVLRNAFLLLSLVPGLAFAQADTGIFQEAWKTTQRNFYDRRLHGVDWKAVRLKYEPEAKAAKDTTELIDVINRMLGELKASHTVLIDKNVYKSHFACEMSGKQPLQAGLEVVRRDGGWFVGAVLDGGAAAEAGVRKGDRVFAVDGESPEASPHVVDAGNDRGIPGNPHFFVEVKKARPVTLLLQGTQDEASLRTVTFQPARGNMIEASRHSVRVLEEGGLRLGYVHLYHFLATQIGDIFSTAIHGELKDCDGLILDIRGRGGSPFVMNRVFRDVQRRWKKPVVLLIDEGSRSAKEIFAHNWKKAKLGPVIGRRTAGAVLGSNFMTLSDGSVLLLPVVDVPYLSGGVKLEGIGVTPDIEVTEPDMYTNGHDLVLDRGTDVLVRRVREARTRDAGAAAGAEEDARSAEGL
ncbi:MAG: hypothetical protein HYZ53_11290 [Planctomycetes bacterium]|nr:hypothetical protein [Planctomycetota bacterium]